MCGLIGFSGKENFDLDKIRLLLYYNSIERNSKNATGIWSLINGIKKSTSPCNRFLKDTVIEEDNIFMGHVRLKTYGGLDIEEAHPHSSKNIISIHNGTLTNHWTLCREAGLNINDYKTDSQVLTAVLAKESKPDIFSKLEGTAAIIFTDSTKEDTLYIFRNEGKHLYRGRIDGDMYISSEEDALHIIECEDIEEFKDYCLYTIENSVIKSTLKLKKPVIIPVTINTHNNYSYGEAWRKKQQKEIDTLEFGRSRNLETIGLLTCNLRDRWILTLANLEFINSAHRMKLTAADWYYCTDTNTEDKWKLSLKGDDFGNPIEIYKSVIRSLDYSVKKDDYLIGMYDITQKTNDEILVNDGDLLIAEDNEDSIGQVNCLNLINGKRMLLVSEDFRIALQAEVEIKRERAKFHKLNKNKNMVVVESETNTTLAGDAYNELNAFCEGLDQYILNVEVEVTRPGVTMAEIKKVIHELREEFDRAKKEMLSEA